MLVVFVCTGNICRSAMAEALARQMCKEDRPEIEFSSMGTDALVGEPADDKAIQVLAELGIDLSRHRARYLVAQELSDAELILCMDRYHLTFINAMFPQLAYKTFLLNDYPEKRWFRHSIADPYKRSLGKFRKSRDTIKLALERLLKTL